MQGSAQGGCLWPCFDQPLTPENLGVLSSTSLLLQAEFSSAPHAKTFVWLNDHSFCILLFLHSQSSCYTTTSVIILKHNPSLFFPLLRNQNSLFPLGKKKNLFKFASIVEYNDFCDLVLSQEAAPTPFPTRSLKKFFFGKEICQKQNCSR